MKADIVTEAAEPIKAKLQGFLRMLNIMQVIPIIISIDSNIPIDIHSPTSNMDR